MNTENFETYDYSSNIKKPNEIGAGRKVKQFEKNIQVVLDYIDIIIRGKSRASRAKRDVMGNRFFYKTAGKCKSGENQVDRSIYINNITMGDYIPGFSKNGNMSSDTRGLVFGMIENTQSGLDPMGFLNAVITGDDSPCTLVKLPVVDNENNYTEGEGYVLDREIKELNPCLFSCKNIKNCNISKCINPLTKIRCKSKECKTKENFINESYEDEDLFIKTFYATVGILGIYLFVKMYKKNIFN